MVSGAIKALGMFITDLVPGTAWDELVIAPLILLYNLFKTFGL
jgi:hypothetical protein